MSEEEDQYKNFVIEWKKDKDKFLRQNSGIIIASAFSMIIFLLSLIRERTLILDFGIALLLFSIIIQYSVFRYKVRETYVYLESWNLKDFIEEMYKIMRKEISLDDYGVNFFFLGIMFLFSYFKLMILSFFILIYLCGMIVKSLYFYITSINNIKKTPDIVMGIDVTQSSISEAKKLIRSTLIRLIIILISTFFLTIVQVFDLFNSN